MGWSFVTRAFREVLQRSLEQRLAEAGDWSSIGDSSRTVVRGFVAADASRGRLRRRRDGGRASGWRGAEMSTRARPEVPAEPVSVASDGLQSQLRKAASGQAEPLPKSVRGALRPALAHRFGSIAVGRDVSRENLEPRQSTGRHAIG